MTLITLRALITLTTLNPNNPNNSVDRPSLIRNDVMHLRHLPSSTLPYPLCQVAVGVGALAGSTIMLLTIPWFLSIVGGQRE